MVVYSFLILRLLKEFMIGDKMFQVCFVSVLCPLIKTLRSPVFRDRNFQVSVTCVPWG